MARRRRLRFRRGSRGSRAPLGTDRRSKQLIELWTDIYVDREVAYVVMRVRESGVLCHLATNQEVHKARYMSEVLGYRELFDRELYFCALGIAKPAVGYFRAVVGAIALPPKSLLFIDDRAENIESARSVGMHGAEFSLSLGAGNLQRLLSEYGVGAA